MSMGMNALLTTLVILLTILCIVLIVYIAVSIANKPGKERYNPYEDPNMIKILADYDFNKISDTIDGFINDAGEEYKINNFSYKNPEDVYLTEEGINDMIKFIVNKTMFRITAQVFTIIKISYNISSEQELIQFLYDKARAYVLAYSIKTNAEIE